MSGVIVHEWLERRGGAENVLEQLALTFPDARLVALWNDDPGRFPPSRVDETWLAKTPLRRHKSMAVPFMSPAWRTLGYSDAEWILSSSHLFAHHARFSGPARDVPKYVYTHTPARYIWNPELDVRGTGPVARLGSALLKPLDRRIASEATAIAANSKFVAERIERAWHRESTVIYPPVDVATFSSTDLSGLTETEVDLIGLLPETFLLGASRFIPYKRLDLAIKTGLVTGLPVVLAGGGPELAHLTHLADEHPGQVTFVPNPSRLLLRELYRRSLAFVFPPVEDFGIMPVEAMAAGARVIASSRGGASETVLDGVTGVLVDSWTTANLVAAVDRIASLDSAASIARAQAFGEASFRSAITSWIPN